mmetsp:Transcript_145843/g.354099  ORF Transcript_145843/g.354099 Transcript_145843/m.354099 type:complete len:81 (+) Transcript_145843:205-447(+)
MGLCRIKGVEERMCSAGQPRPACWQQKCCCSFDQDCSMPGYQMAQLKSEETVFATLYSTDMTPTPGIRSKNHPLPSASFK